jgi:hypothetical protein
MSDFRVISAGLNLRSSGVVAPIILSRFYPKGKLSPELVVNQIVKNGGR